MKKKPNISVAPVTAFIGYPRSGKTYHMTMIALELMAAGENVASRHEIKGALPITSDLEMVHLAGFHVFLDEWHIDRPAKEWRHTPRVITHLCSQAAKYDLHIYWSAQDWFFMPYEIRAVTEYAWVHESIFRNPHTDRSRIGLHRANRIAGCEIEAEHRNPPVVESKRFFIKKKIAQAYNSKRAIFVPEDVMTADDLQNVLNPTNRSPIGEIDTRTGDTFRDIYFVEADKRRAEREENFKGSIFDLNNRTLKDLPSTDEPIICTCGHYDSQHTEIGHICQVFGCHCEILTPVTATDESPDAQSDAYEQESTLDGQEHREDRK